MGIVHHSYRSVDQPRAFSTICVAGCDCFCRLGHPEDRPSSNQKTASPRGWGRTRPSRHQPLLLNFVSERIGTIDLSQPSADDTTVVRLIQTAAALEDVRTHPIIGTGTASFQLLFNWDDYLPGMGADTDEGGWIGNSPVRILHETGIVGLSIFALFVWTLASAVRKAMRIAPSHSRNVLVALSAGLILYAITFQATEATILAFTWVHLGLLGAAVQIG